MFSEMSLCIRPPSYRLRASPLTKAMGRRSHQERQGSKLIWRAIAAHLGSYFLKHGSLKKKHDLGGWVAEIGNRQSLFPCIQAGKAAAFMLHDGEWNEQWEVGSSWQTSLEQAPVYALDFDDTVSLQSQHFQGIVRYEKETGGERGRGEGKRGRCE